MKSVPETGKAYAENFDSQDEFHNKLQDMCNSHGRGTVSAIVWDVKAGRNDIWCGMVICQLQYGMSARAFSVVACPGAYSVRVFGTVWKVKSDYFDPF